MNSAFRIWNRMLFLSVVIERFVLEDISARTDLSVGNFMDFIMKTFILTKLFQYVPV